MEDTIELLKRQIKDLERRLGCLEKDFHDPARQGYFGWNEDWGRPHYDGRPKYWLCNTDIGPYPEQFFTVDDLAQTD